VEGRDFKEAGGFGRVAGFKNMWRITVALEKLAGIEGQDSDEELLS